MVNEHDMIQALAECDISEAPNYAAIARKYNLERSTLSRRHRGKTTSRELYESEHMQCLTNAQERVLINQINRLNELNLPPTSQIVRNFAEEMIGRPVGKNWAGQFVKRHQSELLSLYLRNINNKRVQSEYLPNYQLFFDLVKCFFVLLCYFITRIITNMCISSS